MNAIQDSENEQTQEEWKWIKTMQTYIPGKAVLTQAAALYIRL